MVLTGQDVSMEDAKSTVYGMCDSEVRSDKGVINRVAKSTVYQSRKQSLPCTACVTQR